MDSLASEIQSSEQLPQTVETSGDLDKRNPDGTFALGHPKIPGSGRRKKAMTDFWQRKFNAMSDTDLEDWCKKNKVSADLIIQMAEGRPKQSIDGGEDDLGNPLPLLGGVSVNADNNSNKQDNQP